MKAISIDSRNPRPQITRKQLEDILQSLLAQKKLIIEIYQSENRKEKKRYRSAPSTTGGMGEERAEFITDE